jgi:outer membrane protein assembly factor BamE (lipoprotein component of BamABCDE complex)
MGRRVVLAACALCLGACASTVKFGSPPLIERLDSLRVGESTPADILLALGEPRGDGRTAFAELPEPRDIWFYEHIESDGKHAQVTILVVLTHEERYDGYMWFSSFQAYRAEGSSTIFTPPDAVTGGYFPPTDGLETDLLRGRSNRADVLAALGSPIGSGGALLPPAHVPMDLLYYEDMELTNIEVVRGMEFRMETRQRILAIFLDNDVYSGFMWYSNLGTAEAASN